MENGKTEQKAAKDAKGLSSYLRVLRDLLFKTIELPDDLGKRNSVSSALLLLLRNTDDFANMSNRIDKLFRKIIGATLG